MTTYSIYALIHPTEQRVRYIGLSKDVQKRYKQHINPSKAYPWVRELLQQHLQPTLQVVEPDIPDLPTARVREQYWIRHYEGRGIALENFVGNEAAIRERAENEAARERLRFEYARHLPPEMAEQLIRMMIKGHGLVGVCAWEDTYCTAIRTINLLAKRPGFGLQLTEIDVAKITFNIFGYDWEVMSHD